MIDVLVGATPEDIDLLEFNKYAWTLKSKKALKEFKQYLKQPLVKSFTMWDCDNNKPLLVLAFHSYVKGCYYAQIVADKGFGNPSHIKLFRKAIDKCIAEFGMQYIQTISEDEKELNKWHTFIGWHKEKDMPNYCRKKNFILWSM